MTIRLSATMQQTLRSAPDFWRSVVPGPTVDALKKRGLIELRDKPGEKGLMAGFQWRITETGREVDGRGPAPTFEVTVWDDTNGDIVKKLWEATDDEVDEIREQYEGEGFYTVQVEERA